LHDFANAGARRNHPKVQLTVFAYWS
jgi:hypothetical protein